MNLQNIIREKIQIPFSDDLSVYKDMDNRIKYTEQIVQIVNEHVPKIQAPFDKKVLDKVEENGYCVIENFLTQDEVDTIVKFTEDIKGYQFHVPGRAFNQEPQKFNDNLDWNVCSYKVNQIFKSAFILRLITRPDIIALTQEYLGCLPVIKDVNLWWSKYTGKISNTQNIHRDYDDFKFVAFFIYLTDVNDENGPHIYYNKTHKGSDDMSEKVVVTGKAGTAIFGDTYALHHGQPLTSGKRLMFWVRYSLHKNNNFFRDKCEQYRQEPNMFFDVIDDTAVNRHLLSAFTKESDKE